MPLRRNPLIYEINTAVWLADLSKRYNRMVTLADVPAEALDTIGNWGFDAIWMMGVWERSPRARQIGLSHPDLAAEYNRVLPGWTPDQVLGSPYAVHRYAVDPRFGRREGLAAFRLALRDRGLGLILDFVPNHVAVDHPWTIECPNCLVQGSKADASQSGTYFLHPANSHIFAHGRDPYFPAWSDTVQIDAFSETARTQARDTLLDIATQCDGVRCDMAMLLVNGIFAKTWNIPSSDTPNTEYWQDIIPDVKTAHPDFLFMAEVYWDMEAELHNLGFDYCYDKRLYDRMLHENIHTVRDHLLASLAYQQRLVRFVENHDEPRANSAFGPERSQAAATLALTLPGAKLVYEGQLQGRKIKVPVQLGDRPDEVPDPSITSFYHSLIAEIHTAIYHDGTYMALGTRPILNNDGGYASLLTFAWALGGDWRIVAVNLSDQNIQGRVMLSHPAFAGSVTWQFADLLGNRPPTLKGGDDLLVSGLEIGLEPYGRQILSVTKA